MEWVMNTNQARAERNPMRELDGAYAEGARILRESNMRPRTPRSFLCEYCDKETLSADLRIVFEYGEPVEICPECEQES
jgi:hypothetical protein